MPWTSLLNFLDELNQSNNQQNEQWTTLSTNLKKFQDTVLNLANNKDKLYNDAQKIRDYFLRSELVSKQFIRNLRLIVASLEADRDQVSLMFFLCRLAALFLYLELSSADEKFKNEFLVSYVYPALYLGLFTLSLPQTTYDFTEKLNSKERSESIIERCTEVFSPIGMI